MLLPVVQSNDEEDGDAGHRTLSLPPLPPQGEGRKAMSATVWVVDDDRSVRFVLATALQEAGFDVVGFDAAAAVLDALAPRPPQRPLFTDGRLPGDDLLDPLHQLQHLPPGLPGGDMSASPRRHP